MNTQYRSIMALMPKEHADPVEAALAAKKGELQ